MKTEIVRIGNSQGIRLPKTVLQQSGISGAVELEIAGDRLIIYPVKARRAGWAKAFSKMHGHKEDKLTDQSDAIVNQWDNTDWRW